MREVCGCLQWVWGGGAGVGIAALECRHKTAGHTASLSLLPHPSGRSTFVRSALNQRRKRDVIMSFLMNSEGNKEFKEENSGDAQRAEAWPSI